MYLHFVLEIDTKLMVYNTILSEPAGLPVLPAGYPYKKGPDIAGPVMACFMYGAAIPVRFQRCKQSCRPGSSRYCIQWAARPGQIRNVS